MNTMITKTKRTIEIWTLVNDDIFQILKEEVGQGKKFSVVTKYVMWIIQHYKPEELLEDYTFRAEGSRKIAIMLNDREIAQINGELEKFGIDTYSTYLRSIIYTYLRSQGQVQ